MEATLNAAAGVFTKTRTVQHFGSQIVTAASRIDFKIRLLVYSALNTFLSAATSWTIRTPQDVQDLVWFLGLSRVFMLHILYLEETTSELQVCCNSVPSNPTWRLFCLRLPFTNQITPLISCRVPYLFHSFTVFNLNVFLSCVSCSLCLDAFCFYER